MPRLAVAQNVLLPSPIIIFRGVDDGLPMVDDSAWQRATSQPLSIRTFDGKHFFAFAAPEQPVRELVRLIDDSLVVANRLPTNDERIASMMTQWRRTAGKSTGTFPVIFFFLCCLTFVDN